MVKFQAMVLGAFLFGSLNAQILPINTHAAVQAHGHNGQGNGVVNECVRNVAACKNVPGECRNNGRPAGNNIVTNGCYDGVLGSANNQHGQEHAAKGGYNGVHGRVCQPGNSGNSQVDNSVKPKECVVRPPNGGNCYQPQPPKVCGGRPENSSEKPSKDEKSCNKSNRSKSRKSKSPRKCEKSAEKRLKSGSKCGKSKEKSSNKNNRSKSKNSNSPNKWGKSNEKRLRSASKGHSKEKQSKSLKRCNRSPKRSVSPKSSVDNKCKIDSPKKCVVPPRVCTAPPTCVRDKSRPSNSPNKCSEKPKGWEKPHENHQQKPNECSNKPQGNQGHQGHQVHQGPQGSPNHNNCQVRTPKICPGPHEPHIHNVQRPLRCNGSKSNNRSGSKHSGKSKSQKKENSSSKHGSPVRVCHHQVKVPVKVCQGGN